jgi:PAS domain-containing protein
METAGNTVSEKSRMGGDRWVERLRNGRSDDSPMDVLTRLPAAVMLERLPVPTLAMARDGVILVADKAFAEMVGCGQDRLAGLAFPDVFHTVPAAVNALWRRCAGEPGR